MSIRSILVPLDGDADNLNTLETALGLARVFGAHVDALHVRSDARDAVPLLGEGMSGDMVEEMINASEHAAEAKAATLKAMFDKACKPDDDSAWTNVAGREDEEVAWRGRLTDLIVTQRPGEDSQPMRALTIHAALFESGHPVLVLPEGAKVPTDGFPRTIAIAWNGTAEAAHAVHGAMPLITRAAKVCVLTCESTRTAVTAADELATYLTRWGVTAEVNTFPPGSESIGATMLDEVAKAGADLLVCGAYSHARFMQIVLGGVTSVLMEDATIPVLFSH